ncbi:liprin-beta-1-like isoform X2 [Acanthaster planci]|uniref:Liprin-beta-1-like isoform X2 n=1 Tax=Acanthaster planci TaxID=133434 RepID=A0A8B7XPW6_ACAPL|nr:liprin-beta-1-like isoform X2 [Acanthaster planci]
MSSTSTLASDATQMLAAALEQMDDIIAGTRYQSSEVSSLHNGTMDSHNANFSPLSVNHFGIAQLADELKHSVELAQDQGEAGISREGVPDSTRQVLVQWLQGNSPQVNGPPSLSSDQVQHLEGDKESLLLQISVLSDQVEAQSEAIQEMEKGLAEESSKLAKAEAMLQEEMTARAELEAAKLSQMTDLSNLRIRLSSVENDLSSFKDRAVKAESLVEEKQMESSEMSLKYQQSQGKISELQTESNSWQEKYMQGQVKLVRTQSECAEIKCRLRQCSAENERLHMAKSRESDHALEVEKLKRAVETLLAANHEKDKKIEDLKKTIVRHQRVQELMMNSPSRRVDGNSLEDEPIRSDSFSTSSSVGLADTEESPTKKERQAETPVDLTSASTTPDEVAPRVDSPVSMPSDGSTDAGRADSLSQRGSQDERKNLLKRRSASLEDIKPAAMTVTNETSSGIHQQGYSTLPSPRNKNREFQFAQPAPPTAPPAAQQHQQPPTTSASSSATATALQASTESDGEDIVRRNRKVNFSDLPTQGTPPSERRKKKGGIKKLFGKLKRSNSASLTFEDEEEEDVPVEFRRGGRFRATAGPRLGWTGLRVNRDIDAPFAKWEGDQVAAWLHEMGLGQYMSMCRVWVKNGATLLKASPLDLERELGVRNVLHRKKLQLALQAMGSEEGDRFKGLDHNWVTRWLDDVGLPQYKDAFSEARIDGRMLHYLTVDDLLLMRVTSGMHHVSIMRGIQCLRLHNFQPNCLRRRPTDEPYEAGREVMLWTNHRVMEWLRTVDLSEYAPNLRGSGIHGALMVLEPRFTAETLATTLCIPNAKSLLRRHLSTHFVSLVGGQIQAQKRETEKSSNFVPLSALSKVKPKKRPFGGRPKKKGMEEEDYVCPMNLELPPGLQGVQNGTKPSPSYRVEVRSAGKVHRQGDETSASSPDSADGTPPSQIGVYSEEINTLTNMLNDDQAENGGTNV